MSCVCDSTTREFPAELGCLLRDNNSTEFARTPYLGGDNRDTYLVHIDMYIPTAGDVAFFKQWYFNEIGGGTLDFEIEIPIFGVTAKRRAYMTNKLKHVVEFQGGTFSLDLEIPYDEIEQCEFCNGGG